MRKSRTIISGMVFSTLTLGPMVGWSQTSPAPSDSSGSGIQKEQKRQQELDSPKRSGMDPASSSSVGSQWSRDDVRNVQEALKGKGHNPGPIDGVLGPRTQQALRAFQRSQNIQTSGQLDSSTASALGVTLSSATSPTPGSSSRGASDTGSSSRAASGQPSGAGNRDSSGTSDKDSSGSGLSPSREPGIGASSASPSTGPSKIDPAKTGSGKSESDKIDSSKSKSKSSSSD